MTNFDKDPDRELEDADHAIGEGWPRSTQILAVFVFVLIVLLLAALDDPMMYI